MTLSNAFLAACSLILVASPHALAQTASPLGRQATTFSIAKGNLSVLFRDNSTSPRDLSGVQSLFNVKDAPGFDGFDPDSRGASAGLNFEHIISGHPNGRNKFTPRHSTYTLHKLSTDDTVALVRRHEDSPWAVSSQLTYTVREPHYLDLSFRCRAHDRKRFGTRGYAIFFFANYMNDVAQVPLQFRGIRKAGGAEEWIAADGPKGHIDWNGGGSYRHKEAGPLAYDSDHNFRLNSWSYDYPRFTKPFYYGRTAKNMVFLIMFDRSSSPLDQIRFSIFKFKLPWKPRPAWDFQYVVNRIDEGKEYGFRARVVWKRFVSPEDCLKEYETWVRCKAKAKE